ncbi:RING-H2 finger protein ATL52-like [Ipomoea triloba]|uniref:RING-H2 finger protein ATL52-like n=1 Tax=Ipomoea triloba TaxID=35885 RepID=UPI00125DE3A5|nr:RING-H2 finger protein ATL52-like [Ipomoea triloba]
MVRAVTRLCAYTSRLVAIFFYTWLPQALRITILAFFVALNRCGRAYARYQYRAMVRREGRTFVYRRKSLFSRPEAAPECAICLSEFVEGEVGRELERCRHVFHAGCVEKWLLHGEGHGSCPLCRSPVVVPGADVGESWKDERGEGCASRKTWLVYYSLGCPRSAPLVRTLSSSNIHILTRYSD